MADNTDLQTVDQEGRPASTRFKDAQSCLNFAKRLEEDDIQHRAPDRLQIKSMMMLQPPWKRTAENADRTNVNWGEGKNVLKDRKTPFLTRLAQESEPISVEVWERLPQQADDYRRQLTTAASNALIQWTGSSIELGGAADDMGAYGLGVVIWPEERDPRFERMPLRRVFFPAGSKPDIDRIDAVVVKYTWTAAELWRKHESEAAEKLGYSKEGIERVMQWLYMQGKQSDTGRSSRVSFEDIRERMNADFVSEWISGNQIDVYHVVFRDVEGSFSTKLVCEITAPARAGGKETTSPVYICERDEAYEELSQFMGIFPLDPTAETIHALRGYGHDLVPKALAASRSKCQLIDHWDRSTMVWFQSASADAAMRLQMHRHGPYGVINTNGLEVAEITKSDKMPADMGALGMLEHELRRGTPSNAANPFGRAGSNRPSATAEDIQQQDANEAVIVDVSMFETFLDRVYMEFYRRLTMKPSGRKTAGEKVRQVFHDWVKFYDLPNDVWKMENVRTVSAKRTVGPGSPFVRKQAATNLMSVRGALPPSGQHEVLELYIAAHAGAQHVRRFLPTFDRLREPDHHNWQANQESHQMLSGSQSVLPALGDQNDGVHIEQHLTDFQPRLQAVQAGQVSEDELVQFSGVLNVLMPHLDSHLQRLDADETRKAQYQALKPPVEDLRRLALNLDRVARQITQAQRDAQEALAAQQAAQAQGGVDPEQQAKLEAKALEMDLKRQEHEQRQLMNQQAFEAEEGRKEVEFRRDLARSSASEQ